MKFFQMIAAGLRRAGVRTTHRHRKLLGDHVCDACGVSEALLDLSEDQIRALCSAPPDTPSGDLGEAQSIRLSVRDEANINMLVLRFGGISRSEVMRIALEHLAAGTLPLAVLPQMAPISDVRQVCGVLEDFVGVLSDAVRHGWPPHFDGESEQRRRKVEAARALFEQALQDLEPRLHLMRVMLATTAVIAQMDLAELQVSVLRLQASYDDAETRAEDATLSVSERERAQEAQQWLKPLVEMHQAIGLQEVR